MNRPMIAIDVDDVLAESTESLRLTVNKKYGLDLTADDYAVAGDYDQYYVRVWEAHGLQEKVSKQELNQMMIDDQSHVTPHTQAYKTLCALSERYELVVITARNPSWEPATAMWLNLHFPDIFSQVIFGGQRESPDRKTKGDICAEMGVEWLIDDNVVHCTGAANRGVKSILYGTYGWHQEVPKELIRCKNWKEIEQFFDGR